MALLAFAGTCAAVNSAPMQMTKQVLADNQEFADLGSDLMDLSLDDFLNLTPKKYREMTGEKLGVKNAIKLKAAQKFIKKAQKQQDDDATDIPKGLYIVGAILGWAWLLMGLMDDFEGNNWWLSILLYILCWIPGVIHAFIKMDEYY